MKLIIDIDDNVFTRLFDNGVDTSSDDREVIDRAVRNGTPYEERSQGDLISRSYLQQMIPAPIEDEYKYVHQIIDNAPTVNAIPNEEGYEMYGKGYLQGYERGKNERSQGEWIHNGINTEGMDIYRCSICNRIIVTWSARINEYPYCHCGAAMRGGAE